MRTWVYAAAASLVAAPAAGQMIEFDKSQVPQASGVKSMTALPLTAADYLKLGRGYNVFTNTFSSEAECIKAVRPDDSFEREGVAEHGSEYINTVSDMATNQHASSSEAGFGLTYKLVTVGFSTGSSSDSYFNTVDEFARIYKSIVTRQTDREGGTWGPGATPLLAKDLSIPTNMERFIEVCGTHYIKAIYYGHRIDTTIRFALQGSSYTSSGKNGFSLGVAKLFNADYSDTKSETDVRNVSRLELITNNIGLIPTGQPDVNVAGGVKALVKYARIDFNDAVAKLDPKTSAPIGFEIAPYYVLNVPQQARFARTDAVLPVLVDKMDDLQRLLTNVSELKFAAQLGNKISEFYDDDMPTISAKLVKATAYVDTFRDTVRDRCLKVIAPSVSSATLDACRSALRATLTPTMLDETRIKRKPAP